MYASIENLSFHLFVVNAQSPSYVEDIYASWKAPNMGCDQWLQSAYRKLTKQLIFMSLCQDIVNHRQSRYPRIYPAINEKCRKNHIDHGAELAFAKIVRRNLPFLQVFFLFSTEQISKQNLIKQNLIEYIMRTLSTLYNPLISSWY